MAEIHLGLVDLAAVLLEQLLPGSHKRPEIGEKCRLDPTLLSPLRHLTESFPGVGNGRTPSGQSGH